MSTMRGYRFSTGSCYSCILTLAQSRLRIKRANIWVWGVGSHGKVFRVYKFSLSHAIVVRLDGTVYHYLFDINS